MTPKGVCSTHVLVQIVVTEHNAEGMPLAEHVLPAVKVFRASAPDVWAAVDQHVAQVVKASTPAAVDAIKS